MPNIICLGELLIDFCAADSDVSLATARTFVKAPGGAPANVAVALVRLGQTAGFIGAVGDDPFGEFLAGVVAAEGVDVSHLARVAEARTTLAFIASRSDGRKDISFYRNPGADMMLSPAHIDRTYIQSAQALHFGSISRIDAGPRQATDLARRMAAEAGLFVTYDPNWRPSLWRDPIAARAVLLEGFAGVHVAKVSQEEWPFITGFEDFDRGAEMLMNLGPKLVVRSEGENGATFATSKCAGHVDAFAVKCVEPTGAGDACMASLIVDLLPHWRAGRSPGDLDSAVLTQIVRRANAVGARATTKMGAIPSLPTAAEVDAFLAGR